MVSIHWWTFTHIFNIVWTGSRFFGTFGKEVFWCPVIRHVPSIFVFGKHKQFAAVISWITIMTRETFLVPFNLINRHTHHPSMITVVLGESFWLDHFSWVVAFRFFGTLGKEVFWGPVIRHVPSIFVFGKHTQLAAVRSWEETPCTHSGYGILGLSEFTNHLFAKSA